MLRVLFVTNIPSPYQLDFFSDLSAQPELQIHVLFAASSESDRQFTLPAEMPFSSTVMKSRTIGLLAKDAHYAKGLFKQLEQFSDIDLVVISGSYFMPTAFGVRRWVIKKQIPWIYWGENPWKKSPSARGGWKDLYLRIFLRSAIGVFGVGERACETYRQLISKEKYVWNLPYAPNLQGLAQPQPELRKLAAQYRAAWPIEQPQVIIFSGSLTDRKAPDILLDAFLAVQERFRNLCVMFAGDGPLRQPLEAAVHNAGVTERVRFLGFVEGDELRAAYLSADLFILPTRTHEGWGVVVQEALAAGLPVLVSDSVGAGYDLIDEFTGQVFSANEVPSLAECLIAQLSGETKSTTKYRNYRIERALTTTSANMAFRLRTMLFEIISHAGQSA